MADRSLAFGFEDLGLDRVIARYDPNNLASGKVMEKLWMRHLCDMPSEQSKRGYFSVCMS